MRYLPTLDLWDNSINEAVRTGQIKLQTGQWVKCGNDRPSRWAGMGKASMVVAHPKGDRGVSMEAFKANVAYVKSFSK